MGGIFLQREILFLILFKIRCLRLGRNALIGFIPEFTAFDIRTDNTALSAKDRFLVQFCAESTI